MKTISVMNLKGGTGKTTMALCIAAQLSKLRHKVTLIDCDGGQGSAYEWSQLSEGRYFSVVVVSPEALAMHLKRESNNYDFAIVDCPPRANKNSAAIIKASDYCLLPVQPSPFDVWATSDLIDVLVARREATSGFGMTATPAAGFAISRGAKFRKLVREVRDTLIDTDLNLLKNGTNDRETYKQAFHEGRTHLDCSAPDEKAEHEIKMITKEILAELGG